MVGPSWLSRRCGRIYRSTICVLGLLLLIAACKSDRTPELLGEWQATLLVEEGDTVDVILDDVGLRFDDGGKYVYTSTLDYEEEGTFRTKGDMLFSTPANQDTVAERRVAIEHLDESSLHLRMKQGQKYRVLEFERIQSEDIAVDTHNHDDTNESEDVGHSHAEEVEADSMLILGDTTGTDEIND